jgi:hypothetical protein
MSSGGQVQDGSAGESDLSVLLVHGVPWQNSTLANSGGSLQRRLGRRLDPAGGLEEQTEEWSSPLRLGRDELIDHMLASRALVATLDHGEIDNHHLPDEAGAFRAYVTCPRPTTPRWPPSFSCLTTSRYCVAREAAQQREGK